MSPAFSIPGRQPDVCLYVVRNQTFLPSRQFLTFLGVRPSCVSNCCGSSGFWRQPDACPKYTDAATCLSNQLVAFPGVSPTRADSWIAAGEPFPSRSMLFNNAPIGLENSRKIAAFYSKSHFPAPRKKFQSYKQTHFSLSAKIRKNEFSTVAFFAG